MTLLERYTRATVCFVCLTVALDEKEDARDREQRARHRTVRNVVVSVLGGMDWSDVKDFLAGREAKTTPNDNSNADGDEYHCCGFHRSEGCMLVAG